MILEIEQQFQLLRNRNNDGSETLRVFLGVESAIDYHVNRGNK